MNVDRDLLERAQQGDPEAQTELIRQCSPRVFRLIGRYVSVPEDVEDLAQDVFFRVFTRLDQVRPEANFAGWLTRVTINVCYDELRKRRRRNRPVLGMPDPAPASAREPEAFEKVRQALEQVDPKLRVPLVLKEVEGMSVAEISEALGITVTNVKVRLFRARRKIESLLKS